MTGLFCNPKKKLKYRERPQRFHTKMASNHISQRRSLVICTVMASIPFDLVLELFLVLQIFLPTQNAGTPQSALSFSHCPCLFQRRRWVSLWTHSSTVTRSTSRLSTGECWECVVVNTVCCCWQYWYNGKACGIPPLPKQLAHCGLHQPNVTTNHTVTLVHQFHLTINLQRTFEPQYCSYRLQAHYKPELKAFHCQFLKYTERFGFICGFRNLDAVWTVVPDLVHTWSLCEWLPIEMCGRKGKVDLSYTGLRTDCSTADWILIQKYLLLFIFTQ